MKIYTSIHYYNTPHGAMKLILDDWPWVSFLRFPLTFLDSQDINMKEVEKDFIRKTFNWYPYVGIG